MYAFHQPVISSNHECVRNKSHASEPQTLNQTSIKRRERRSHIGQSGNGRYQFESTWHATRTEVRSQNLRTRAFRIPIGAFYFFLKVTAARRDKARTRAARLSPLKSSVFPLRADPDRQISCTGQRRNHVNHQEHSEISRAERAANKGWATAWSERWSRLGRPFASIAAVRQRCLVANLHTSRDINAFRLSAGYTCSELGSRDWGTRKLERT